MTILAQISVKFLDMEAWPTYALFTWGALFAWAAARRVWRNDGFGALPYALIAGALFAGAAWWQPPGTDEDLRATAADFMAVSLLSAAEYREPTLEALPRVLGLTLKEAQDGVWSSKSDGVRLETRLVDADKFMYEVTATDSDGNTGVICMAPDFGEWEEGLPVDDPYRVIWMHGCYLDVMPTRA